MSKRRKLTLKKALVITACLFFLLVAVVIIFHDSIERRVERARAYRSLDKCIEGLGSGVPLPSTFDVILRCSTIVSNSDTGHSVQYRPIRLLKGEVPGDLLDSNGLIRFLVRERDPDVALPGDYWVCLSQKQKRSGIYKDASFNTIYHYTFINAEHDSIPYQALEMIGKDIY